MLDLIVKHKDWLFSGLGVAVAGWLLKWVISGLKAKKTRPETVTQTTIQGDVITATGDVNKAEKGGKITVNRNCVIGVQGDHAKVGKLEVK